jgi:hypothetical protein
MVYTGCINGIMIVGGCVVAALLIVALARRQFGAEVLRDGHDASGNLLSIVGTLYAVLLGLVVVDAMVRFERAMDGVQTESNCLADSSSWPNDSRTRTAAGCRGTAATTPARWWITSGR